MKKGEKLSITALDVMIKSFFEKYQVITDYNACGGISSDHYPIFIEGYFLN